jgi:hypothetical protein
MDLTTHRMQHMKRNETLGRPWYGQVSTLICSWHWRPRRLRPTHFPAVFSGTQTAKSSARGSGVKRAIQFALNAEVALAPDMTCRSATASRQRSW